MKKKRLRNTSLEVSALGQGTGIGGFRARAAVYDERHIKALRHGIEMGMTFIDSSEEYGMGEAERTIARAIDGMRDRVFVATKVSSENLAREGIIAAAEASLGRLGIDCIDLYQVHWSNPAIPIEETMESMTRLMDDGKIRFVGVCNFSMKELEAAESALPGGRLVSMQAEYNLVDRAIEGQLLPYCAEKGMVTIAYSPLDQGRIASRKAMRGCLEPIAEKYGKTPAQVVLNWLIAHDGVIAVSQSSNVNHIEENAGAADFELLDVDLIEIDRFFSPVFVHVPPDRVKAVPDEDVSRSMYRSMEEALENRLNSVPSPEALAQDICVGEVLKPIKAKRIDDKTGRYDYELIEGRLRFWAWVIAFNKEKPVPLLVKEED